MQTKIMHANCGIIKLINNDQYTRLSVFKLPRVFFVKRKLYSIAKGVIGRYAIRVIRSTTPSPMLKLECSELRNEE
jgi:hypothetical protein